MNIEHISISRGKLYKECEYKYKLKYHEKLLPTKEEPFYFVYGKIIHRIAQIYVEEKAARSLSEVSADVLRGKILLEGNIKAPKIPQEYKVRMPNHLNSVRKITEKLGTDGLTEHPIYVDLDPPNKKYIKGFIDRIIFKNDSAIVLDYKTTKPGPFRENAQSVKFDPQLRYYARFVSQEFKIPAQNISTALLYLDDYQIVGCKYTEQSLIDIEKDMLHLYNTIATKEPDAAWGKVGQQCPRCEYSDVCPFFKNKNQTVTWDGDLSSLGY